MEQFPLASLDLLGDLRKLRIEFGQFLTARLLLLRDLFPRVLAAVELSKDALDVREVMGNVVVEHRDEGVVFRDFALVVLFFAPNGFDFDLSILDILIRLLNLRGNLLERLARLAMRLLHGEDLVVLLPQLLAGGGQLVRPEGDFQRLFALGELEKLLGLFALGFERPDAPLELPEDVAQPNEVFLRELEPALRFVLAVTEFGDPGRLLKDLAAVVRLGGDDLVNPALPDHRIAVAAEAGVHKQLGDLLEPHLGASDQIFAVPRAVVFAGDSDLVTVPVEQAGAVVKGERHLGKALRFAALGADKNDVLHFGAAQRLGGLLTEHPAHRVADVALAAAVWPDNSGHPVVELEQGFIRKRFEALQLQRF